MTRATFPSGLYSIALPDGSRIVEYPDRIEVNGSRIERPGNGLLAMVARKFQGFIYIAGQENDQQRGTCWLWTPNGWKDLGPTHGVRPCAFGDDSLFIAVAGDRYTRTLLNSGVTTTHPMQIGSQGIRYVNGSVPVPGDATIFDGTVHEFIDRGDVRCGQGHEHGALVNGRLLEPGNCQFINFERDGDALAVAMVKFLEGQSVLYWLTRAEVDALPRPTDPPPPIDPPPPPPPVDPPEPPMSVRIPDRVKVIVQSLYERNLDLAHGDDDQRRALTMKCAQQVRFELGERWGTKRAAEGRPPSKDALAYFDGAMLFSADCFNGTTREPSVPDEMEPVPGQVFIAVSPINHLSAPVDPPPPPPPPPDDTAAKIARLEARVKECEHEIDAAEINIVDLTARLTALENKTPPVVTVPPLKVKGKTSAAGGGWWGKSHTHDIDIPVVPE